MYKRPLDGSGWSVRRWGGAAACWSVCGFRNVTPHLLWGKKHTWAHQECVEGDRSVLSGGKYWSTWFMGTDVPRTVSFIIYLIEYILHFLFPLPAALLHFVNPTWLWLSWRTWVKTRSPHHVQTWTTCVYSEVNNILWIHFQPKRFSLKHMDESHVFDSHHLLQT